MKDEKKTAAKQAETVTISRTEYESQQAQLAELKLQNQWLLEQLGLAKKRQFGSSSEKMHEEFMDQLGLPFNELEAYAFGTKSATPEQIAVKAHARKRKSGNVLDVVPEGTPTEVVEHRLPEEEQVCEVCGSQMVEIGKEVHRTLKMEPPKFWIREDVYYTYACKNCELETGEANILKTPKEPALLPGSFASAEAVAHIAVQKFVMYSPLYRLEQEFNRQGLKLSRQTMSNWLLNVSEMWLQPIYNVLHEKLCKEQVLHADETTLQVLKEAGRPSTSKSYMWLYRTSGCAEQAIVLYEYQPTRKAEHAENFLKGFSGWLHADGYQGYHRLPENIRVVGCWAHARRKFDEALQTLPKEKQKDSPAAVGECYCSRLFKLEEAFAELTPEKRYEKRLEQEKPVLDALLSWANEMQAKTAPKSAMGRAIHYLLEQWPYLIRYLEDGRLELSNNRAERSIKPFVMGRKNWLFANTPGGAQASSVIYSLIETAKENGLDPYRYLLWVLRNAPALSQTDVAWAGQLTPASAPDECRIPLK
ncbi:IS66 family transposase [Dysosmobacter sp. HCP28S3_G4]|uniref:IS66 family transposase n=1 Tax=Dysosmobacter sp. HCP28S3_G4 TaxID=3438938 RepID=UPI003F8C9314